MKHKGYFLLFIVLVLSDQFTKQIFMTSFELGPVSGYKSVSELDLSQNTGAAFSILSDGGLIGKYFLLGVSILVSLWLIWWAQKTPAIYKQKLFGQFFLLSGAVGNLIDRALYGYVIDFIDLHVNSFLLACLSIWPIALFLSELLSSYLRENQRLNRIRVAL
jgi:signal peptidase II